MDNRNSCSTSCSSAPSGDVRIENLSEIFHPDDLQPLYRYKGNGLEIPQYNRVVKRLAKDKSKPRIQKIKEYCQRNLNNNRYLSLANQHVEDTNKFLYFDFYYAFLYCQTQKVLIIYRRRKK